MPRTSFLPNFLRNLLFALLLAGAALGLGHLAALHPVQRDLTFNASNSLEPASISALRQLAGPVLITVYATEKDVQLGDIRKIIKDFVSLYQRYKPDVKLVFIDPEKEPEKARAAQVQLNGEMVVEYAGRSERLTTINEDTLTGALLHLAHAINQTVMYLDGDGERKLDGNANHDLGLIFGAKLKQNGYRINSLNLAIAQDVPTNASMLVITGPQVDLMPGEVDKILRHVDRGGNLLWLIDPGPLHGLERLAEKLGLQLPPVVVIDPSATRMNAPDTWALGTSYPPHAITNGFNLITAFPAARPLMWRENGGWQHHVLVDVAASGWAGETPDKQFDKQRDTKGPFTIALALSRNVNSLAQRIVVVGNGAFLSNTYAGNGGNVDLGVNMLNWLAHDEKNIALQPRKAKDSSILLSRNQLTAISVAFLIALPMLLFGIGIYLWWVRRRA
jgi:ABC-type uncharacterized transport system involved in gliding motility auxiliary subunit